MSNETAFRFINASIQNPIFDSLLPIFSDKDWAVIPGVALAGAVFYFGRRRTRVCVLALLAAVALADLTSARVVKNLTKIPRPYAQLEGVHLYRGEQWTLSSSQEHEGKESWSFPSSHAANVAAAAAVLALFWRRTLWLSLPIVFLVGLSRVYTGHHFVEDVLAGMALGGVCGAFCATAARRMGEAWVATEPKDRPSVTPARRTLYLVIACWTLLNFAFIHAGLFDLAGDEAQYWDWSRRLDLGYYSKPPLIAYAIHILTSAGGDQEWAIRSGAILLGSSTLALMYAFTLRIGGSERTALLAVFVALGLPAFWAGSVLMTPDSLLCFFWMLTLYAFHQAVHGETRWWWVVGLGLGLGMLSKYTMALLVPALAGYLVCVNRFPLRTRGPYLALGVAAASMSGVAYWNWAHDWVSLRHTASIGAGDAWSTARAGGNLAEFFGAQLAVASPILLVMMVWAVGRCLGRWAGERGRTRTGTDKHGQTGKSADTQRRPCPVRSASEPDAALLALAFLAVFGAYAVISLSHAPEPNWAVCAYLAGVPALAWTWRERGRGVAGRRLLVAGVALGVFMGLALRSTNLLYLAATPFTSENPSSGRLTIGPFEMDPDADPTNALRGGRELGAALSTHFDDADDDGPFLFSDRYQLTAWAGFYTKGKPHAYCMNIGDRRYNQYDLWGGWEELAGRDGLFVTGGGGLKAQAFIAYMVAEGMFESGELIDTVLVRRGNVVVKTFHIALMRKYSGRPWKVRTEKY